MCRPSILSLHTTRDLRLQIDHTVSLDQFACHYLKLTKNLSLFLSYRIFFYKLHIYFWLIEIALECISVLVCNLSSLKHETWVYEVIDNICTLQVIVWKKGYWNIKKKNIHLSSCEDIYSNLFSLDHFLY